MIQKLIRLADIICFLIGLAVTWFAGGFAVAGACMLLFKGCAKLLQPI